MTNFLRTGLLLLALLGCTHTGPSSASPAETYRERFENEHDPRVLVVAHRACWMDGAPENSLAALRACIGLGAEMAEIDVARTRDGILVLLHDATLDRTTTGSGPIADFTLSEVRAFRLRAGAGGSEAAVTEERVPTLREALEAVRGHILINLDLKADVAADALQLMRDMGLERQVLLKLNVSSEDPQLNAMRDRGGALFMPILRECVSGARVCHADGGAAVETFQSLDPVAFELVFSNPSYLTEAAPTILAAGERVWVNTLQPVHAAGMTDAGAQVDADAHWGRAIDLGATVIQTDYPRALITYLESRGRR